MIKQRAEQLVLAAMANPAYPAVLQIPTLLVFTVVTIQLLFGPVSPHDNFGTAMTWVIWWPVIPLVFILLGRFWCAVCPFATISDWIQKLCGNHRPVPKFLRAYGIWIIDALFILITWADHVYGLVESPFNSGLLLLAIVTGVVAAASFFERRSWCKHLCFLGGLAGNYSRSGMIELTGTPEKCSRCKAAACYHGGKAAGPCPMFESPKTLDSAAECNLCGQCVKNCPNNSVRAGFRIPSAGLWNIRSPRLQEASLAVVIMGIVFVQNITMLDIWPGIEAGIGHILGTDSYAPVFTVAFLIAMAIPVGVLLLASWLASKRRGEVMRLFTVFGYALIPLDLAGHVAHNLFHLLAEGKSVVFTAVALFGGQTAGSAALVGDPVITALQYTLIVVGLIASLYAVFRLAQTHVAVSELPRTVTAISLAVLAFATANVYLFSLPMHMRM